MMRKLPGRPTKPAEKRVIKKPISFTPENYNYIMKIIDARGWDPKGSFSKIVNEIIGDHTKVKRFKDAQAEKHKEALEMLES